MGLGTAVFLLVIVIGIIFFWGTFSNFLSNFGGDFFLTKSQQEDKKIQDKFDIKPTINQNLCDLKITFYGEIEHELLSVPTVLRFEFGDLGWFNVQTKHPEVAQWEFINCEQQGTLFSLLSLIPALYAEKLQDLDIIGTGDDYTLRLKIIAPDGSFRTCEKYPALCKTIHLPIGINPEPIEFQKTFLIENIPQQNYTIEVTVQGQKINNMPANAPYIYNVRL